MDHDVFITVAYRTPMMLLHAVNDKTIEIIRSRSLWPIKVAAPSCTQCENGGDLSMSHFATSMRFSTDKTTEYCAWLNTPTGDKHPWSMIADGILPEEVFAFTDHLASRVSVQPHSFDHG